MSLFEADRLTMDEAVEITTASLMTYGERYPHWAVAYSGGKDSSATVTLVAHLIASGKIPAPQSLHVLYADTRMELPPLRTAAMDVLAALEARGIRTQVVLPPVDERFFVYILGRGVPPPKHNFRWCTPQLKIEPMIAALAALRQQSGQKLLMITGVRLGESAVRDARIAMSCSRDGAECGQGWLQQTHAEAVADTLAPLLHWRVCHVWDWLKFFATEAGFPTQAVADVYGGDEAEEINARTGCIQCPLASRDTALDYLIRAEQWRHLTPLKELRPLYEELRLPRHRLRKDGTDRRKDGSLASSPMRMGPLTLEAREWALGRVLDIQGRASVDLVNAEEEARIRQLIADGTWPNGWNGDEAPASALLPQVLADGVIQHALMDEEGSEP